MNRVRVAVCLLLSPTLVACAAQQQRLNRDIEYSSLPMPAAAPVQTAAAELVATPAVQTATIQIPTATSVAFITPITSAQMSECQANFEEKIAAAMKVIEDRRAALHNS